MYTITLLIRTQTGNLTMKRLYLIFCLFFWNITYLNADTAPGTEGMEMVYCPAVEQVMHDPKTNLWGIGDWVSGEPSFEKSLVSFQGAQWVGANLGTVICVYKSDNVTSFPVTLQNTTLSPMPDGPNWGKYENGRKNCPPYTSEDPVDIHDCPFYFPKKENKQEDIYQQLDFFKNKKNPTP